MALVLDFRLRFLLERPTGRLPAANYGVASHQLVDGGVWKQHVKLLCSIMETSVS